MATVLVTITSDDTEVMQCADQADQVRRLFAFLEPVMSLQTEQERFEKYQEIWSKLNPNGKTVWVPHVGVNFPWDSSKIEFWKTLRGEILGLENF
jgi:hypothetical protein